MGQPMGSYGGQHQANLWGTLEGNSDDQGGTHWGVPHCQITEIQ